MATIVKNFLTEGLSGRIGNVVFRQVKTGGGRARTVVTMRPQRRKSVTPQQKAWNEVFRNAACYAKSQMLDPVRKAHYTAQAKKAGLGSPYIAAVKDFLKTNAT